MSLNNVIVVCKQSEVQDLAQQISHNVFAAESIEEAVEIAKRIHPDLVLFDRWTSRYDIVQFSTRSPALSTVPVVIIGNRLEPAAEPVDFLENRQCHYLDDAQDHQGLREIVRQIKQKLHFSEELHDPDFFCDPLAASVMLVGKSGAMRHTLKMINLVAASRCNPVLIIGEMGTGKELAAKAIHLKRSPEKAFIAVNCASLNANLLESELFGHEKGSFTSAEREKTGLLEMAGEGCIFLDEISEMPLELQAKLLRVIQEKTFRRVGGTKEIECRATIIASSNRDLKQAVRENRFRGDLYHRLSIFPVVLTPLRSAGRRDDIALLATYFLQTQTICPEKTGQFKSITKLALETLEKYDWPGNVRELRNVIDRAVLLETTDKIGLGSIIIDPERPEEYFREDPGEKMKDYSLAKAEQELIARVLRDTHWKKSKAAELLGISRATLYAKVKQHNIPTSPDEPEFNELDAAESGGVLCESEAVS